MKDKELADAVVALGVLRHYELRSANSGDARLYTFNKHSCHACNAVTAEIVVQDWRVTGAILEKVSIEKPELDHIKISVPVQAREVIEWGVEVLS